jgi:hypothetical protein
LGFDSSGYQPAQNVDSRQTKGAIEVSAWLISQTPFQIVFTKQPEPYGTTRSQCSIDLAANQILPLDEQRNLPRMFMIERTRQIAETTHARRDADPVYPIMNIGYGPVAPGAHGCQVIFGLSFLPDGTFFSIAAAEQFSHPCAE